jgi:hypothetical protein
MSNLDLRTREYIKHVVISDSYEGISDFSLAHTLRIKICPFYPEIEVKALQKEIMELIKYYRTESAVMEMINTKQKVNNEQDN